MDLFDISSDELKTDLFVYTADILGSFGLALHVKGRESGNCQFIENSDGIVDANYGYCLEEMFSFCGFQNLNPDIVESGESEFFVIYKTNSWFQLTTICSIHS
jgi:hypothetical protein